MILDPVPSVNVRLRGSSKLIRQLNPYQVDVQVELAQTEPGTVSVNLGPENVLMPEGLEVVSIEPNTIRVELEREITQRVPVVPHLVGEPAAGVGRRRARGLPQPGAGHRPGVAARQDPVALHPSAST